MVQHRQGVPIAPLTLAFWTMVVPELTVMLVLVILQAAKSNGAVLLLTMVNAQIPLESEHETSWALTYPANTAGDNGGRLGVL